MPREEHSVAIIGMSGRFPGAKNVDLFWNNLCQGKESITQFSDHELDSSYVLKKNLDSPSYVKARGILTDIADFDADFFKFSPREAELTDPQHRLFLECCYESLEDAGYPPNSSDHKIGVYGGVGHESSYYYNILTRFDSQQEIEKNQLRLGNEPDHLTTRVSYKLNLTGPSMTIQTACSTSLVTVCIACSQLLTNQCTIALAGAATISIPENRGYHYQKGMIFSSDGHCRPFDKKADGTVPGNGVGVVVLKQLEKAVQDNDHIYAVIRGFGINNDGAEKIGYCAPSAEGQKKAIQEAIKMANIEPETISYIETHGTGTAIGDPIEIEALSEIFKRKKKKDCAIGSVKGNIGHLMETAGIAGLIKTSLALKHQILPASLHFECPNPYINFETNPFYINSETKKWTAHSEPRRALVNSLGFGGTNAYLILEEAPSTSTSHVSSKEQLFILSAKTKKALEFKHQQLKAYLEMHPDLDLANISFTLQVGRETHPYRHAFVASNTQEVLNKLTKQPQAIKASKQATMMFSISKDALSLAEAFQLLMNRSLNHIHVKLPTLTAKTLHILGKLWMEGVEIHWNQLRIKECCSRISLPTYPFERTSFWLDFKPKSAPKTFSQPCLNHIEETLKEFWKESLGMETVHLDDHFFHLGGDSLLAIQIISQIQKTFEISLPFNALLHFPTIRQLASSIRKEFLHTISNELVILKEGDKSCPIFFIHQIDGHVFSYKQLANELKCFGQIYGIESGAISLEKEITIEKIARNYINKIKKIQYTGPYQLLGASFGGLVAYEMAQQLKNRGDTVSFLTMIDLINPTFLKKITPLKEQMFLTLVQLFSEKSFSIEEIKDLSEEEKIGEIMKCMHLKSLPFFEQKQLFKKMELHWEALINYQPKPYLEDLYFFEANNKPSFIDDLSFVSTWEQLGCKKIHSHLMETNHLRMMTSPYVTEVAQLIHTHFQKKE